MMIHINDNIGRDVLWLEANTYPLIEPGNSWNTSFPLFCHMQGLVFINEYAIITTLGRGSFGEVKLALNTIDMEVSALKLIPKTRRRSRGQSDTTHIAEASVLSEINVMKELSHPNLVRLKEVIGKSRPSRASFAQKSYSEGSCPNWNMTQTADLRLQALIWRVFGLHCHRGIVALYQGSSSSIEQRQAKRWSCPECR